MRSLLEIAKSGMSANQRSISVTSNNIANANTEGYSRQRAVLSPKAMNKDGLNLGLGVSVQQIQRIRSQMIDSQIEVQNSQLQSFTQRANVLQQLESVFIPAVGGLDESISNFFGAFSELSNTPQDFNLRNNVISKSRIMMNDFKNLDADLKQIARETGETIKTNVEKLNTILSSLAEINAAIERGDAAGAPDNNSLDLQTQKLKELSELIKAEINITDQGAAEVRINGIVVLNKNEVQQINTHIDNDTNTVRLRLDNSKIIEASGGKIGGNIEMFENEIPDYQVRINEVAKTLVEEVNAVHASGFGINDTNSRVFFDTSGTTAETIAVNPDLITEPAHLAASSVAGETGNNEAALELAAIQNKRVMDGQTIISKTVELISDPGSRLIEVQSQIAGRESAIEMLRNQQESFSGVNIDEELSELIKFQNAYQASVRVLSTAQEMYDSLLRLV